MASTAEGKRGSGGFKSSAGSVFGHAVGGHGAPIKGTARDDLRAQMRRVYKTT